MEDLLQIACNAAATASELLMASFAENAQIQSSVKKDIKTLADVEAQNKIIELLAFTNIPIIAEEEGVQNIDYLKSRCWLIDPLDGTLNFTRKFPIAAVSIALWENGKPLLGVIHDINYNTVYKGIVGKGTWVNNEVVCVSKTTSLGDAIIATGFPSGRSYATESLMNFVSQVQQFKKVRMLGSAALMLAQVAAGRFDAYHEEDIYLWDVAAGLVLVKAAGGSYEMEQGSGTFKYKVKATNGKLKF
jgi:myo-inositol-1(or 4)-monophosphatase